MLLEMHVGATQLTKEQKSVSTLEIISNRNEDQQLYDELVCKNIYNFFASIH